MKLWDFALAAWARPGVSEICLRLQDRHGQCVPLLLWRAWAAVERRDVGVDWMRNAVALARTHEREMIAPLREARRAPNIHGGEATKRAELAAEAALLNALEALTSSDDPSDSSDDVGQALAELIQAWNGCRARSSARTLAARLG